MLLHAALLLALLPQDIDPAKELGSVDPARRLAGVKALVESGHEDAEKLLLKALKDDDWEVATIAATGLARLGGKKSVKPLLDAALEGPVLGLRRAAAESLAELDPAEAYAKLSKELSGDEAVQACQAIWAIAPRLEGEQKTKDLEKLLDERHAGPRRGAARALLALAGKERPVRMRELLEHPDPALRAAVLEAAGERPELALFEVLAEQYADANLPDYLERRVHAGVRATVQAFPDERGRLVEDLVSRGTEARSRQRVARVLGMLAEERASGRALDAEAAMGLLKPLRADTDADVRAAVAAAYGRIATDEAWTSAAGLASGDGSERVRRVALGVAARLRGAKDDPCRALLLERLKGDADPRVRETAASYLGVRGRPDVVPALVKALEDPDWRVVTVAAVSLGKTEDEAGCEPLLALLARGEEDWRTRASAVAGLTRLRARPAVPALIAALEDEEALVARTAYEFLAEIARQRLDPEPKVWTAWWEENGQRVKLSIPEEVLEARRRLEYVRSARELFSGTYVGIDVLVLQSRGDHIEDVLEGMEILHRRTTSGQLLDDGLHPQGVFVSNCTGEVTPAEKERLAWFVRAGGALFGSCWALRETIQDLQPGLLRKQGTRGEVLGDVPAYPTDPESRYLEGVFGEDTRPIYHLEGAHLIEVLDPEEVEVLIDSPECAAAFGGANLAAWFRLGHGVVLDSANHFEGQGFKTVTDVRDPEARKAYAIDHLGLTYPELRELRKERFWNKTSDTAERVKDLSVFRLITNFVWLKRLAEE